MKTLQKLGAIVLAAGMLTGCGVNNKAPEQNKIYTVSRANIPDSFEHYLAWEQWKNEKIPPMMISNFYINSPAREEGMGFGAYCGNYYAQIGEKDMKKCGLDPKEYVSCTDYFKTAQEREYEETK